LKLQPKDSIGDIQVYAHIIGFLETIQDPYSVKLCVLGLLRLQKRAVEIVSGFATQKRRARKKKNADAISPQKRQ